LGRCEPNGRQRASVTGPSRNRLPGFSHQHDGCQAQGKGGGVVVGIAVAIQRRLPS